MSEPTQQRASRRGWLEERLGLKSLMSRLLAGEVDPKWSWLRTTGMACLVLVLVECVTGPILGLYYSASPESAYKDILAIQQNPMGRFLRGLHHWSSAALILLALFTIARMFFTAEYKGRRDVVWMASVIFLQLVLGFQLTGHLLPWDTNAVATTTVEAGMAANLWGIGPDVKRLMLGGSTTGGVTLARWYGVHALVLPLVTLLVVGLPLFLSRLRLGSAPAPEEVEPPISPREPYYPNHMAREMVASLVVFLVVAGLALFWKTPLEKEATADNLASYTAMSEWYVLPMHAATLIPPFNKVAFEPIATLVGPGLLMAILLVLPFVDRNPERRPARRKFAIVAGALTVAGTLGLYLYAFVIERPMVEAQRIALNKPEIVIDTKLAEMGKLLYERTACNACHAIGGKGNTTNGPDLTKAGVLHPDRQWQIDHLKKPDALVKGSTMPPYAHMKDDELRALAEYMVSLR